MNGKGILIWFSKFSKFPTLTKLIQKWSRLGFLKDYLKIGKWKELCFLSPPCPFLNSFLVHNALQNNGLNTKQTHDNNNHNFIIFLNFFCLNSFLMNASEQLKVRQGSCLLDLFRPTDRFHLITQTSSWTITR